MPRILHIIPTLVRGGAEKQLALLAAGLPKSEFDVQVAVLTHTGPLEQTLREENVPVTLVGKRWKVDPFAFWRLKTLIRRLQPDIVHTWLFAANSYGRQAAFAAGVKFVIAGERCVDPWKTPLHFAIDRSLAHRSARIVTNSSGVKDFYVRHGLPAEKFAIIPNGMRIAPPREPLTREQLWAELKVPPARFLIGVVGRLWPQKRLKDLIWAADLLKATRDDWQMVIVGDGPQRWRLQRYRDQIEIADRVHFLGERSDVARLMPHFDLLWLGSGYEGQSNAILEAMAAGVPVVATDIPGNRDLVVPGETGLLLPVGDRFEFARKSHWLLEDDAERRRLGAAGRERIAREFTVEQMVSRHAALYREVLSQ